MARKVRIKARNLSDTDVMVHTNMAGRDVPPFPIKGVQDDETMIIVDTTSGGREFSLAYPPDADIKVTRND